MKVHDLPDRGHRDHGRSVAGASPENSVYSSGASSTIQQGITGVERHVTAGWCTTTRVVLARTIVAPLEMYATPPEAPTDAKLSCIGQPSALPM